MSALILLMIVTFLAGIYFCIKYSNPELSEGFTNPSRCPNVLIQKDSKFYLYNSRLAKVPGVNPIEFNNLEEYSEFLDWQHSQKIRCPVLYLQKTYDAQGDEVYKVRPGVTEPQGGLPPVYPNPTLMTPPNYPNPTLLVDATQNDRPYNINSYPSYDESSYYVGTTTPLDEMDIKTEQLPESPNAMDPNWGGAEYTDSLVKAGYYKGNEVKMRV